MYIQYYAVISVKIGHCFQHKQFKLFFPTFRSQVPNETLLSEDQSLNIWNNSGIYSHGPILLDCMYIVYVQSIFSAAIQNFGLKFSWYIFYASLNIGKKFVFLVICRITKVSSFDMYSPSKLKIWHGSSVNPLITLSMGKTKNWGNFVASKMAVRWPSKRRKTTLKVWCTDPNRAWKSHWLR